MSPERRDDFESHREAKELGPYPSWARWKVALISRLGSIPLELEDHLHEWYVIRRKFQLGEISKEEMTDLTRSFSDKHDELFNDEAFISAFKFITDKTAPKS